MAIKTGTLTGTVDAGCPSRAELTRVFASIGLLSFGGPAAQTALMHREIVAARGWLDEREFLAALGFCMLLPGPEAMQLATYAGWRLQGLLGGLIAGLLFVLPGAIVILGLGWLYATAGDLAIVAALFLGIKAAVLGIVLQALVKISARAIGRVDHRVIALLAFVGLFFLDVPYPLIVLTAAAYGCVAVEREIPGADSDSSGPGVAANAPPRAASIAATLFTIAVGLLVWWLPILALDRLTEAPLLVDIGIFFSKLAVLTFGGAYAVLAWLAQDVVDTFGWLTAGEMMDGLGLAETTPGPLILVTEFAGFLAAYREGGLALGIAGAIVTLWVTFVPCFIWIFAGAPWLDTIASRPRLRGALASITAAVVGVIANLSLWFALHVFFGTIEERRIGPLHVSIPDLATLDWRVVTLALLGGLLLFGFKRSVMTTLAVTAGCGLLLSYAS